MTFESVPETPNFWMVNGKGLVDPRKTTAHQLAFQEVQANASRLDTLEQSSFLGSPTKTNRTPNRNYTDILVKDLVINGIKEIKVQSPPSLDLQNKDLNQIKSPSSIRNRRQSSKGRSQKNKLTPILSVISCEQVKIEDQDQPPYSLLNPAK